MPTESSPVSSPVSGPVAQVCWVVPDIAASESFLASVLGIDGWTSMGEVRFAPGEATHRGRPADFMVLVSLAWAGDLQVELIQPVAGESLYAEFLTDHPAGGLHHVAFETDDLEASVAAAGLPVLSEGSMGCGLMRFAYLDGSERGVPFVELLWLSEEMREIFAAMRGGPDRGV